MTDQTLAKLIEAAEDDPSDGAAVCALTDMLGDASAADRMEAVLHWVTSKKLLRDGGEALDQMREFLRGRLPKGERLSKTTRINVEEPGRYRPDARRYDREEAAVALIRALENGHTYAVRIEQTDEPLAGPASFGLGRRGDRELRTVVHVSPLDGGRIDTAVATSKGG